MNTKDIPPDQKSNISESSKICGGEILKKSPRWLGYKNYSMESLGHAVQASIAEKSMKELSKSYNIPSTTIYENKKKNLMTMRSVEEVVECEVSQPRFGGYRKYSEEDLDKAAQASTSGSSVRESSRKYSIPRSTISDRKKILEQNISDDQNRKG